MKNHIKLKDIASLFGEKKLLTTPELSVDFVKDSSDEGEERKNSYRKHRYYTFYTAKLEDYLTKEFDFDFYTERVKVFLENHNVSVYETATLRDLLIKVGVYVVEQKNTSTEYSFSYTVLVIDPKSNRKLYDPTLYEDYGNTFVYYSPEDVLKGVKETKEEIGNASILAPAKIATELQSTIETLINPMDSLHARMGVEALEHRKLRSFSVLENEAD